MLAPQFSLRWLLAVITACALFSLLLAAALSGSTWAIGVAAAAVSLGALLLIHAGVFFLVWVFSLLAPLGKKKGASPFHTNVAAGPVSQSTVMVPAASARLLDPSQQARPVSLLDRTQ